MSLTMGAVVHITSAENMNVHIGSAILYSGYLKKKKLFVLTYLLMDCNKNK